MRRTQRASLLILFAAAASLATSEAYACRCIGQLTPRKAFALADAVVFGEVTDVAGQFDAEGGAIATLRAARAWKAGMPSTFTVETRTTCAFDFRPGETYLVYLTRSGHRAPFSTTICAGNRLAGGAGQALDWLHRNAKPSRVDP